MLAKRMKELKGRESKDMTSCHLLALESDVKMNGFEAVLSIVYY